MSSTIGEISAFDVMDATRALQRRWKLLLASVVIGVGLGIVAAWSVTPVWESVANIQIGVVYGRAIEDARSLASILESEAFLGSVRSAVTTSGSVAVRAQPIEAGPPGGSVAYIRIVARGQTAGEARNLATYVVNFVKTRHARLFDTGVRDHTEYLETLARASKDLEAGISRIESNLEHVSRSGREGALTALLLQSQLDSNRMQHLRVLKELRDARLEQAMNTSSTIEMGPPSAPEKPIWPGRLFFPAVGAALALFVAVCALLMFGRSGSMAH